MVRKLLEYTTNLEKKITLVLEDNRCLHEDNTRLNGRVTDLENEIHRLKGLNCKPDIKPNTKPPETPEGEQLTGSGRDPDSTDDDDNTRDKSDDKEGEQKDDEQKDDTGKPDERTRKKRKKPPKPPVTNHARRAPNNIPEGSIYKVITPYDVQELSFSVSVARYELEHWITPDGSFIRKQKRGQVLLKTGSGLYCAYLRTFRRAI